jgi:hypothetical protein
MISFECEVMPRALSAGDARVERRRPGIAQDVDLLGGSQRVVTAHITSARSTGRCRQSTTTTTRHVAVRGGDQRGALGVAV